MVSQYEDRKILLVEDDKNTQLIHTYFLQKLNFDIDLVSTGTAALQHAKAEDYFAMILDLGLPDMDGEQVLLEIREQEKKTGRHLPIIIVTAHGNHHILSQFKSIKKADDGFTKPVHFLDFQRALQKLQQLQDNWIHSILA